MTKTRSGWKPGEMEFFEYVLFHLPKGESFARDAWFDGTGKCHYIAYRKEPNELLFDNPKVLMYFPDGKVCKEYTPSWVDMYSEDWVHIENPPHKAGAGNGTTSVKPAKPRKSEGSPEDARVIPREAPPIPKPPKG